jgi:hypothetical protein
VITKHRSPIRRHADAGMNAPSYDC